MNPAETVDGAIAALARGQHGVFSRAQALELGATPGRVQRRLASGRWQRPLPGVYRIAGTPDRGRQAAMGAALWAGEGAVVSHRAAGVLWGLDGIQTRRVEVTVPTRRAPASRLVLVHRTLALPDADRAVIDGIPVTSAARTIVDLAGLVDDEQLEVATESGFRRGLVTASRLRRRLDELGGSGRSGATRLGALLDARGAGAAPLEYRLEVKVWRLLLGSDLPRPVRQLRVEAGARRYRLDFAWPERRVALEADGFASHGHRAAFHRDRDRLGDLGALGWRVIPVTWEAVTQRPQDILRRVGAALGASAA